MADKAQSQMLINYLPGEECRVAIVEHDKLEEYHVERFSSASRVGNIYVGRVANVEPAIQAAFVDFGVGENGFLHVSDLHPRYFPGEDGDATERVGLKTPRRERPPIQACLRRGDEVIVQVLKEGVGTKGPTLTSYLSIPGRFLVMMPYMDKTGVSRKVEDEDQRRKMKEILDQLELPEGFGFIVRTAGMDRTKTELKRDLAYLQRLWKDMERRLKGGSKPRLLYSESDLLVRALRDLLTPEIEEIIIDHPLALKRAARFLKIVSPRGQAKLLTYPGGTPLFHAYGIEQQVALIHAREVPLPSGGRLVIDQTEALVAIDVNSGRSRESRDSETNAYQTNIEAVDEICRQLRLRDMGGIVINDLIDMRSAAHRKDIEARVKERLKRDRARSTVLAISEFGILQLTRQRMRPSHESLHFVDCPTCRGRGLLQKPESIAADALRDLGAVIELPNVAKAEMVVAPRVAGELLSSKRHLLSRIERTSGKHVDVRVSETLQVDRVSFYAYDGQGADIDLTSVPRPRKPHNLQEFVDESEESHWAHDAEEEKAVIQPLVAEPDDAAAELHPIEMDLSGLTPPPDEEIEGGEAGEGEGEGGRRRRRRRRRGRGRNGDRAEGAAPTAPAAPRVEGRTAPTPPPARRPGPAPKPAPAPRPTRPANPVDMFAGDHGDGGDHVAASGDGGHNEFGEHAERVGNAGPRPADADGGESEFIDESGSMVEGAPGGGPGENDGGPGEGGRRRRRRRRRGRGRGGQGGGGPDGGPIPGGVPAREPVATPRSGGGRPPVSAGPVSPDMLAGDQGDEFDPPFDGPGDRERVESGSDEEVIARGGPEDGDPESAFDDGGPGDGSGAEGGEAGAGPNGEEPGEGGRRRRRRRRRRGRGGRGTDGGAPQGPNDAGSEPPPADRAPVKPPAPRPPAPRAPAARPPAPRPPAPRAPAPTPPPQQVESKAAASKPRTLYGGARRKLNPSELNKRPKPE